MRRLAAILLCVSLLLAGCGGTGSTTTEGPSADGTTAGGADRTTAGTDRTATTDSAGGTDTAASTTTASTTTASTTAAGSTATGGNGSATGDTPAGTSTAASPTTTLTRLAALQQQLPGGVDCGPVEMSFVPPSDDTYDPDKVVVRADVPADTALHFVAYEDGERLGDGSFSTGDRPIRDVPSSVPFDAGGALTDLDGTHTITVVVVRDSGEPDQRLDSEDRPCLRDGALVGATATIDFSQFSG